MSHMDKIYGETRPGNFAFGLAGLAVGLLILDPGGWVDWTAAGVLAFGGSQLGRHWGWWRDLSR